jgi:transglutaminase-like putative cysteine protease
MLDSPVDDFCRSTLRAVSGTLGKLQYVAGLRQGNGGYSHWGLARTHGEAVASLAIGQSHTDLFLALLRTPIRTLWEEAEELSRAQKTDIRDYLGSLTERSEVLVPAQLQGGVHRHFNSVLLALCCLAGAPAPKADRVA